VEIKPQSTTFKSDGVNVVFILLTYPSKELTDNAQRYEHARKAALFIVNSIGNHSDYDFFLLNLLKEYKR
jgi:isopenicillin N synthase-like dioxygenase